MKKAVLIIVLFLTSIGTILGQSSYHLTLFPQQYPIINPAYTGVNDFMDLKVSYRNKWAGLENSPTNSLLSIFSPINNKTSYNQAPIRTSNPNQKQWIEDQKARLKFHGVGGQISYFTQGAFQNLVLMANYAYHIPVSTKTKISLGTSMGLESHRINMANLSVWDPDNDQLYQSLLNNGNSISYFTVKMGGAIYNDKFHLGISYSPIIEQRLGSGNESILREKQLDMVGGVRLKVGERYLLAPQIWMNLSENYTFAVSGILGMHFGEVLWAGVGYSSKQNIALGLSFYIKKKMTISYSFESKGLDDSYLGRVTHEVTLGFAIFNHLNSRPKLW